MFGKKRDDEIAAEQAKEAAEVSPRNYQRSDSAGAQPASRPAVNPEIARRGPDLSVFGPGRTAQPAAAAQARPTSTAAMEPEHKKLIVGRDISLNGEIRTCDTLVVEGRVEAVLQDCKNIEIMAPGERQPRSRHLVQVRQHLDPRARRLACEQLALGSTHHQRRVAARDDVELAAAGAFGRAHPRMVAGDFRLAPFAQEMQVHAVEDQPGLRRVRAQDRQELARHVMPAGEDAREPGSMLP